MRFDELPLDPPILEGIAQAGFSACLPVQAETLPHTLAGKDVIVRSQTGSGKTAAFLVSIFQLLRNDPGLRGRTALVIAPTRELADQIAKDADKLGGPTGLTWATFYGGVGYGEQERALRHGCDLLIGTPGRLLDLAEKGLVQFERVGIVVLDEADRLLDMGFFPDIKRMLRRMRPAGERHTYLFSATIPFDVRQIARQYQRDPVELMLTPDQVTVETIQQEVYHVSSREKMSLLLGLLARFKPANGLVFTNTKAMAEEVAGRLKANGYQAQYIMGDLPQAQRLQVIEALKAGELPFLVATDVAARGLHVEDLELVINYDLPENPDSYVHRIGRTARVGRKGRAVTLACERFVEALEAIETYIKMKIPVVWADEDLFADDQSSGMRFGRSRARDGERRGRGERGRDGRGRDARSGGGQRGRGGRDQGGRGGRDGPRAGRGRPGAASGGGGRGAGRGLARDSGRSHPLPASQDALAIGADDRDGLRASAAGQPSPQAPVTGVRLGPDGQPLKRRRRRGGRGRRAPRPGAAPVSGATPTSDQG